MARLGGACPSRSRNARHQLWLDPGCVFAIALDSNAPTLRNLPSEIVELEQTLNDLAGAGSGSTSQPSTLGTLMVGFAFRISMSGFYTRQRAKKTGNRRAQAANKATWILPALSQDGADATELLISDFNNWSVDKRAGATQGSTWRCLLTVPVTRCQLKSPIRA